jgi:ketosteroid isomerase-like protein
VTDTTTAGPSAAPAEAPPAASFDPSVSTAFSVGWRIASLYRDASLDKERRDDGRDELPGPGSLSGFARTKLAVDLIEADIQKLRGHPGGAGIDKNLAEELRKALTARAKDLRALRQRVEKLHLGLLFALTAADVRLEKAFALGHALADTCLLPEDRGSFDRAFGSRIVSVKNWLADLASVLPPHASRAVALSLRTWESWVADPTLDGEPIAWSKQGAGVCAALRRQGELWRALLAGEKSAPDMLDTNHYLRAASALVAALSSSIWRFLRPLAIPLGVAILLLGGGVGLLLVSGTAGQVVGAIAAAAGAVGITGAGLRARLGTAATYLENRLWGAELDLAIAEAVLIGPTGWGAGVGQVALPPTGAPPRVATNIETLAEFRDAVRSKDEQELAKLLAPDVEFVVEAGGRRGRGAVVEWLLSESESTRIASEPQRVLAARPGYLVTYLEPGADVWRLQEGRIRRWQSFADHDEARVAAGLPPEEPGGG